MKPFKATWIHLDAAVFLAQLLHLMHVKQLFHLKAAPICSASYFILIPAQIEAGGGQTTTWFLGFAKIAATQPVKHLLGGSSQKSF